MAGCAVPGVDLAAAIVRTVAYPGDQAHDLALVDYHSFILPPPFGSWC